MWGKAPALALVALACAHYTPANPEAREAGGVRGEIVAINGEFLADFVVRLTPATTVAVGQFRFASAAAAPCSAGDAMKVVLTGFPQGLTLSSETVLTLEANEAAALTRLMARDAVIDIQVGDAAASCLRLPVTGESKDASARWVSSRRWGFGMNGGFAWNYALSPDGLPLVAGLTLERQLGAVRLGVRADLGAEYARNLAAVGPAAGARVLLGQRLALAGELAYEFGGIDPVGFAHGPRASVALLLTRSRVSGFEPATFAANGLELFGGTWFVSDRPSGAVPWYLGAGLIVVLGP